MNDDRSHAGRLPSHVPRVVLRCAEGLYRRVVNARNARFERTGPRTVPPVPVISVGNLTVGGTGKTPFVIHLVHRLEQMGRKPAILSRGYRARDGEVSDEQRLVRRHCPHVACVGDPDRTRAAETAVHALRADVLVLDDGFQHRQVARCLDIVLIDATCPFGEGRLLPCGRLREPVTSLQRADLIVLTRCDQVGSSSLTHFKADLQECAPGVTQVQCVHRVTGWERIGSGPVCERLTGRRALLIAGIGSPSAFVATARTLGVEIVGQRWYPDHHCYCRRDLKRLLRKGGFPPHDVILTTEKDAVKLAAVPGVHKAGIVSVSVAIDLLDEGGTILQAALNKALREA